VAGVVQVGLLLSSREPDEWVARGKEPGSSARHETDGPRFRGQPMQRLCQFSADAWLGLVGADTPGFRIRRGGAPERVIVADPGTAQFAPGDPETGFDSTLSR
jgi:hypothetical protein